MQRIWGDRLSCVREHHTDWGLNNKWYEIRRSCPSCGKDIFALGWEAIGPKVAPKVESFGEERSVSVYLNYLGEFSLAIFIAPDFDAYCSLTIESPNYAVDKFQ